MLCYVIWGLAPLYLKLLQHVPAGEVLAHRVIWSVPVAAAVLLISRRIEDIQAALGAPKVLRMAAFGAASIAANGVIFVLSINNGQALAASIGYYLNPLCSIIIGSMFFGETLARTQIAATILAGAAIVVLMFTSETIPYVAMAITTTWGIYIYFKKSIAIGPNQGFLLESLILLPAAGLYVAWLAVTGTGHFLSSWHDAGLLIGAGVLVTAAPLMLYGSATRSASLTAMGMLQFLSPTLMLAIAVFVFGEPYPPAMGVVLPMIWLAIGLFMLPGFRNRNSNTPRHH